MSYNALIENLSRNARFQRTFQKVRALPPLSPRTRKKMEEKPAAIITKFVEGLSEELKKEATENIKLRETFTHKLHTDSNIITEANKSKIKIKEEKKSTALTENNEQEENTMNKTTLRPIPTNAYLSNSQRYHLMKNFRRIRTYQPHINENWKFKVGLSPTPQNTFSNISSLMNNIEFQSKVIQDQVRLLMDNIFYYKVDIINRENYIESFKALSIKAQIKYNKYLEETCGILLLLPQLLLLEFYHYIEKFYNVNVPDKKKFREKYIFDEVDCLYYNNSLLNDVSEFFKSCFNIYCTLVKEVDDMFLKQKNFESLITILEKARYNISSVISNAENSIANYENDIKLVDKILQNEHKAKQFKKERVNLTDKLRAQFVFKKNGERQRIIRIQNALKSKDYEDNDKKIAQNKDFKSILPSKLIDGLLGYCKKDVKKQIQTKRIMDEMKPQKKFSIHGGGVVKINF